MRKEGRRQHLIGGFKWTAFVVLVVVLILFVAPRRETAEPVPVLKIGFVDMTRLFSEYYETKTVSAEFEAMFNDEEEKLEIKARRANELKKKLQEEASSLSEEQVNQLKEEYNEELQKLKLLSDLTEERLRREKKKAEKELIEKLQKKISEYATRRGYSMILSKSLLLHGAQSFDLTDEIIQSVNAGQ